MEAIQSNSKLEWFMKQHIFFCMLPSSAPELKFALSRYPVYLGNYEHGEYHFIFIADLNKHC